jgi:hypothetical protein
MEITKSHLLQFALISALTSCATTPPISGESKAGSILKSDVAMQVSTLAKIYASCERIDSFQTKILKINPVGSGKTAASIKFGSVEERWVANLCGQSMPFSVTLTPDGEGGTFFSTHLDK